MVNQSFAQTNIAKGKTAKQSSTFSTHTANYAVDGNTKDRHTGAGDKYTTTNKENNPWWEVDLGADYDISQINIFNVTDEFKTRLKNLHIKVSKTPFTKNEDGVAFATDVYPDPIGEYTGNATGRYVRLYIARNDYMNICEVEIYGTLTTLKYGDTYHIKNVYGGGSYLETCGYGTCTDGTYNVTTHIQPNRYNENTGSWTIESPTGKSSGTEVMMGDIVYLKNVYAEGSYLETCGYGTCTDGTGYGTCTDGTLYNVTTHAQSNRDRGTTAKWQIISATGAANGTKVTLADRVYLKNVYGGGSYLETCGHGSCTDGTLYNVTTHTQPNRSNENTGTWSFQFLAPFVEIYQPKLLTSDIFNAKKLKVRSGASKKSVSQANLPCDCHVQGIGVTQDNKYYVVTCQSKNHSGKAYLLLYDFNYSSALYALEVEEKLGGKNLDHPSSIQIENYKFPVAFAAKKNDKSLIRFFKIENNKILSINESQRVESYKHIGALAYSTIGISTYMVGLGWDGKNVHIYKSYGTNKTDGFELIYKDDGNPSMSNDGKDKNWSAYNSCWLGKTPDNKTVLLTTHGPSHQVKGISLKGLP